MTDPNGNLLIKLQVILKSEKDEQRRKANEWLDSLQHNPEKQTALKNCLKAFGIPFEKSEEVILRAAPIFPAMPPSLFGKYFNQDLYQQAYRLCALAIIFEKNGIAAEHATKLAVMFDNPSAMLGYLVEFTKGANTSSSPLHDACLFSLPDFNEPGFLDQKNGCKFEVFKSLAVNGGNMLRKDFKEMLPFAWELQKLVVSKKEEATVNNRKVDPNKIKVKELDIRQISAKLDDMESKKDDDDFNKEEYKNLIQSLSQNLHELTELSAGKYLKDLSLIQLKAFYETYKLSTQGAYKIFIDNGIPAKYFAQFKALNRQMAGRNIPDVMVDGKTIGYPGYYLMKIPVADELQAARAACLGKMTNCCQSLSGEAGQPCVIHGLTSPNGGFYVLCEGDSQQPKVSDKVLAMSWAWRSRAEAIVFDSIEVSDTIVNQQQEGKVKAFFEYLGRELVNNHHTNKVTCGSQAIITEQAGLRIEGLVGEEFKDYDDYHDSLQQRLIYSADEPYYFYDVDEQSRLRTYTMANLGKEPHKENQKAFLLNILHKLPLKTIQYLVKHDDFDFTEEQMNELFTNIIRRQDDELISEFIELNPTYFSSKDHFEALCLNFITPNATVSYNANKSIDTLLKVIVNEEINPDFSDKQKVIFFEIAINRENIDFMKWLWKQYPELDKLLSNKTKIVALEKVGKDFRHPEIADFLMERYGHQIPKYKILQAFGKTGAAKYLKDTQLTVKKWPTVVVEPPEKIVKPKRPLPQTPQRHDHKMPTSSTPAPEVVPRRPLPNPPRGKAK